METKPIRILIADDHDIVREGLSALLNRQKDMVVVAEAANGREALRMCEESNPNVLLIDLRMPHLDGLETIAEFKRRLVTLPVVVLTTFDNDEDIYQGLRLGARAYLLKDVPRAELLECIRSVSRGGSYIPPNIASKLARRLQATELSGRELEVLQLMAAGNSNKEVAEQLSITEGTTKLHVNSILDKLNAKGRTDAVTIAIKRGLVRLD